MITYNWNFNPLTCQTHVGDYQDVVMTVHWQYIAQSGSYTAQNIGTQSFTFNPESDTFIPFDELTKEIVTGWITGSIGEERITQMQDMLRQNIEDQITPKIVNLPAPWNT